MTRRRRRPQLVLAWLIVASGPLASAFTAPASAADVEVATGQDRYAPKSVTVPVGGSVVWKITEGTHTVTAADGAFDSRDRSRGESFIFTFAKAGKYTYFCQYDKEFGMVGEVKVGATGPGAGTAAVPPPPAVRATAAPTTTSTPTTVPETTTTTAPAPPIETWLGPVTTAPPPAAPPAEVPVPADAPAGDKSVTAVLEEDKKDSDDTGLLLVVAGAGGVALLGGGLWAWYHRPSRYLPA